MKAISFPKIYLFFIAAMCSAIIFSCTKDKVYEDGIEGDYIDSTSLSDGSTVTAETAIIGTISPEYLAAIKIRFTNISSSVTSSTKVVIVSQSDLQSNTASIINFLSADKTALIIISPNYAKLLEWSDNNNLSLPLDKGIDNAQIAAFSGSTNSYSGIIPNDKDPNEFLNPLVAWANDAVKPIVFSSGDYSTTDIPKLFSAQTISISFPVSISETEAKIGGTSKPDNLAGNGEVSVIYQIYPLHAFSDQAESGDYYVVNAVATVHGKGMYSGNYISKHGGVKCRICGFYLEQFDISSEPYAVTTDASSYEKPKFITAGTPQPLTTNGQTTYSYGIDWGISAELTGGCSKEKKDNGSVEKDKQASLSVKGGVSFNNRTSRDILDLDIFNNWSSNMTSFTYKTNNLPDYKANITLSNPPAISVSNAELYSSWIWKISGVPDNLAGDHVKFGIKTTLSVVYGSCHFYSSRADFVKNHWDTVLLEKAGSTTHVKTVTSSNEMNAPNREPTGKITVINSSDMYVKNIRIRKSGASEDYTIHEDSMEPKAKYTFVLPVGSYEITLQAGTTNSDISTYIFTNGSVDVERCSEKSVNAIFDFTKK